MLFVFTLLCLIEILAEMYVTLPVHDIDSGIIKHERCPHVDQELLNHDRVVNIVVLLVHEVPPAEIEVLVDRLRPLDHAGL